MNNDLFEELLREATEHFTMQPSRRVWSSLYNNFHPSRKWPSFSSSLFIAFSIIFAGFFNTSVTKKTTAKESASPLQASVHTKHAVSIATPIKQYEQPLNVPEKKQPSNNIARIDSKPISICPSPKKRPLQQVSTHRMHIFAGEIAEEVVEQIENIRLNSDMVNDVDKNKNLPNADPLKELAKQSGSSVFFQFYATPSYGYRFMNRNNPEVISQSSFISNAGPMEEIFELQQSPSLNLEAGGTVLFPINKDFRVKAGMQFNYTNYKVLGEQLPYPFYSNMQLNASGGGSLLEAHLSEVSNVSNLSTGGELLNNNTYQISLPVGTDFKLMGNGPLRWYAGATIQPSYLMGSNPYLITADMKNYINDPSFVRKWNINTSFETFITYQLKGGTILNAGPQIRYQVFSTYNRKYIYDERLYNVGIKLGITPRF